MTRSRSLPLVSTAASEPRWNGFRPIVGGAADSPEPEAPQGAYGDGEVAWTTAVVGDANAPVELLAPAGGLDAGFAAFHFGADAIYLGMKKFSARAEAENFTPAELSEIAAYAHSLSPRRRVFVTINTLIRQDELPELLDTLGELTAAGVDAVIVQDLGVLYAIRRWFPKLELHASTQMAVHNQAGVVALRGLGFRRVVLARELTAEEVAAVTGDSSGVETEVFVHGALCYAYSGLCLFSAQTLGRSGNRGKCSYSCRDSFEVTGAPMTLRDGSPVRRDPREGFPFSMKDLALPDHLPSLRFAGVACFKIEGRKKSPLYVATTTDYYRRLLDGTLDHTERPAVEADLQTVFSRPWTGLFLRSHKDKEVADRDTVGHRGARIGKVERVVVGSRGEKTLRFRTARALEKHDGLQVDLETRGKPFGFAVDRLAVIPRVGAKAQNSLTAPAGSHVEVGLPADAPELPVGAPVYCSSSQEVKQKYRYHRPKPGTHVVRLPLSLTLTVTATEVTVRAETTESPWAESPVAASATLSGTFGPANDPAKMEVALRDSFARLGSSRYELASFTCRNEAGVFVPVSKLNPLRREVLETLDRNLAAAQVAWRVRLFVDAGIGDDERRGLSPPNSVPRIASTSPAGTSPAARHAGWSLKVDRVGFLDDFADEDWAGVDEVVVDITRDHASLLRERLDSLAGRIGRERIRLALPALTRAWEEKNVVHKIESLRAAGWTKWEAANLSAWTYLGLDPSRPIEGLDLATDWSVYVLNRLAARQLVDMGVLRFCLSPEDGFANSRSLWSEFPDQATLIVHQDTPLFLAESCAYANLIGGCPGKANCSFESMEMESSHGESVTAIDYHCRTIVLNQGPYCLSPRLADLRRAGVRNLRADFVYRKYEPAEVVGRWRLIRAGRPVPGGHAANWDRGLL